VTVAAAHVTGCRKLFLSAKLVPSSTGYPYLQGWLKDAQTSSHIAQGLLGNSRIETCAYVAP
jgi:hypothetical protein